MFHKHNGMYSIKYTCNTGPLFEFLLVHKYKSEIFHVFSVFNELSFKQA
jgi:hypothetical protein